MCWNTALLKALESNYGEKGSLHETNTTQRNPILDKTMLGFPYNPIPDMKLLKSYVLSARMTRSLVIFPLALDN